MFWILKKQKKGKSAISKVYLKHKESARTVITSRVNYYAGEHSFVYGRIAIRNQKRCWGSCSTKRNLNFNYRLIFLAPEVLDYIVVHELCHLRHFNHGAEFWQEVERILPDYKSHIKQLREFEKIYNTNPKFATSTSINHEVIR